MATTTSVAGRPRAATVTRWQVRDWALVLEIAAIVVLTAIGLALRLRGLVVPWRDIWIDEAFSIWLATLPPWHAVQVIAQVDQHPPLYALLLHLWLLPRADPWWARLSSVLAGTATIPVAALLGRSVSRRTGLIVAALVCCSPILVRYSQEVRMYALVTLLVFLCTLLLIRAVERNTRGYWIAFALTTLALVYTHNITLFLLPAQALFVLVKARRQLAVLRAYAVTMAGVTVLWLLWVPALIHQSRGVISHFWIAPPTWPDVRAFLVDLVNAFPPKGVDLAGRHVWLTPLLTSVPSQATTIAGHTLHAGFLGPPLLLFFGALALLGLLAGFRRNSLLFLLTFAVPLAINLGLSHWRPIFEERVLLYMAVGALMLVGSGIAAIRFLPINVMLLAPVLWLNVVSLNNYNVTSKKEQWRDAATYLAQQARPGDLILFNATWAQLPFDYYYRTLHGPALVEHGLPVDLFDRGVLEPPMQESDIPTAVKLTAGRQHVWVLLSHDWYNDPQHLIRPTMQTLFRSVQTRQFNGILILRYSR